MASSDKLADSVKDVTSDSLEQLFALYRESFPPSERRSEPDLRAALATPAYRVLIKEDQGQLIGFAILFIPLGDDFALLEYLAVRSLSRSQGIGRALVSSAIQAAGDRFLLTELEALSTDPATSRRQQFYRQRGFKRVDNLQYRLPLPGNPPPMELWVHKSPPIPVHPAQLSRWLTTIYTDVYGCSATDSRIWQMLNNDG